MTEPHGRDEHEPSTPDHQQPGFGPTPHPYPYKPGSDLDDGFDGRRNAGPTKYSGLQLALMVGGAFVAMLLLVGLMTVTMG
ncbi:hypothetical protein [Cryptosporangium aurantiacum]|uniref:Uncharacterized protein n=1 Tax=Cryptosporangium aurantiacum TaxID=134849 RepID=A0A1M7RK88_9ACTN|nr:hypothetical protein [Cryptosporangium aurantiacum]SHN46582.1 hypothetical protein SAMN05443668_116118 [Cryptosporangium aurantiacum]